MSDACRLRGGAKDAARDDAVINCRFWSLSRQNRQLINESGRGDHPTNQRQRVGRPTERSEARP
jgi:hypothetical protein